MERSNVRTIPKSGVREERCENYCYAELNVVAHAGTVFCHRMPPQVVGGLMPTPQGPQLATDTRWPELGRDRWCGEWKAAQRLDS